MELKLIEFFQDYFFQYIIYILSYAGHLFVVLGFVVILYLAVDKKLGAKALTFYFTSMIFNANLKVWISRPRPYTQGAKTIIENAQQYSMPSGHAQGFASLLSPFFIQSKKKLKTGLILGGLLAFLCFTRLYLGQHYLSDVLAGAAIGIAMAVLLQLVYYFGREKAQLFLLGLIPICILLMAFFNGEEYRDGFVSCGILIGSLSGIYLEQRFVKYEIKGSFLNRVLKVLFSLAVTSVAITPTVFLRNILNENLFLVILFTVMGLSFTLLCPYLIKIVFCREKLSSEISTSKEQINS